MRTIFLAAAHLDNAPLPELVDEIRGLETILHPLQEREFWQINSIRAVNLDDIFKTFLKKGPDIRIFHYAGHANQTELQLEGGGHINGIAGLFGLSRPKESERNPLQFVFLNGCATEGQVKSLHEVGIGAVLATLRPIGDQTARRFADVFYYTWAMEGNSLQTAFKAAVAKIQADSAQQNREVKIHRDTIKIPTEGDAGNNFPWGLYLNPGLEDENRVKLESWALNPRQQLSPQILQGVKPAANAALLELVKRFRDTDASAGIEIRQKRRDPLVVLIERLPWILGTHLRRLFAMDNEHTMTQPGRKRLNELITAYHEITQFIHHITLSLLWDAQQKYNKQHPKNKQNPLEFRVIPEEASYKTIDYISRTRGLYELWKKVGGNKMDALGFGAHIDQFLNETNDQQSLRSAYLFMEEIKQASHSGEERMDMLIKLRTGMEGDEGIKKVTLEVEAVYGRFLQAVLFLAQYRLHTVRSIVVDKVHNLVQERPFSHYTIPVHAAAWKLNSLLTQRESATDNYSLLLIRRTDNDDILSDGLNLSPFYIDRSSFIGNNNGNYPTIFVLEYVKEDAGNLQYIYKYIDRDVNYDYADDADLELGISEYGSLNIENRHLENNENERFEKVYEQFQQINEDIFQNPK